MYNKSSLDQLLGLIKRHRKKFYVPLSLTVLCLGSAPAISLAAPKGGSISTFSRKEVTVTGTVVDESGKPVIGAIVTIKGVSKGVLTGSDGKFSIDVPDANTTLLISYIGYTSQEVPLSGKTNVTVTLKEAAGALEDVVMVGYGTQKKSDLTGAIVSVSAEELERRPVANALEAMQGKAAGVDITSNERPGQTGSVLIRGVRSLNASNSPLYVVDGIPLATGGLEALNPNDIESVDILKDASATAIYGSRGANGVILVKTKQGKAGRMTVSYNGSATFETLEDKATMMNAEQYIEFRRAAYRRADQYPEEATEANDKAIFGQDAYAWANVEKGWASGSWDGSKVSTTDWTGMVTRTGITQNHSLSVSGGTEKMKTYASVGYLDQTGTQKGQDYTRYNGKFSIDLQPVKWFRFGGSLSTTYSVQNYGFSSSSASGASSLYFAAQGMLPFAVPFDSTGARINLPGGDINILNPIGEDKYNINERKLTRTIGLAYAELNILPGLKLRSNFGPEFYNWQNGRFMDSLSINRGGGEPGSTNFAELSQSNKLSWTLDNLLYYEKAIQKHNFQLTLLQSSSYNRTETSDMSAEDLPWNSQKWYQLNSVSKLSGYSTGLSKSTLKSYMARLNYSFDNKYLLTLSSRWDGASQLADNHKWSYFPSLAAAWKIDQEDFMRSVSWINALKLRAGLGTTGNAAIDAYGTKGGVQTLYYTWGSTVDAGYVSSDASLKDPASMPNENLGWERTTQFNVGLDFDILHNRISGSVDVYKSTTSDILMEMSIPSLTGYTTAWANIGKTANKGIDITLNTQNIKTRNFSWNTTLTLAGNRSRIVELSNGKEDDLSNLWFIGQRLSVYYDYKKVGIWQNTAADQEEMAKFNANGGTFEAGDIKVADLNGDYKIDANNDRTIVGHSSPNWTGGLQNIFTYKNWELTVFMVSRMGYTIATGAESLQGRYAQRLVDYWTESNPTNDYPSPDYSSAAGDPYKSSMNYQNGSFIKIRNISLGYRLPQSMLDKLHVSNLKFYAQLTNPGMIYSGVSWIDPDLGGSTYNRGVVIGANLNF
ncbi:TonB-linked outer membrane protein, SusC/RagA family [Arachidicoccus rhizosphaerae]|uniref:TonB-linked outer membrane protein, SusC/RagA family n=1 Tax=Arachidicoccus rhizosphaerae TaxID=551991 RepID=A0A1H3Z917_9BACT|nr:TonB-dependent receptor [Arachidicoccus rhizosphaerae]SEA20170.1 TonB-linked outer membrane protein, SusC/RagA family [Arachidicoccus rhizosphaerae]